MNAGARRVARWSGGLVLVLAVLPPIEPAAHELFTFHMVQHLMLFLFGPLLLVAGGAGEQVARHLPRTLGRRMHRAERRLAGGGLGVLSGAVGLHAAAVWAWHWPPAYDLALDHGLVHGLEHAVLVAGGMVLWWTTVEAGRRASSSAAVVAVFVAALQMGALAALLTFAPGEWYGHGPSVAEWGMTRLEDQQLGGAIMWTVGGAAYVAAGAVCFARWLRAEGRRMELWERVGWAPIDGRGASP